MDPIIGIDLGTTNSAVAHLAITGPEIIPNALEREPAVTPEETASWLEAFSRPKQKRPKQ